MIDRIISPVYDELVGYLAQKAPPEEVLAFELSSELQAYAEALLERNASASLDSAERQELEQMLHFDRLVSVLKAKALEQLNRS